MVSRNFAKDLKLWKETRTLLAILDSSSQFPQFPQSLQLFTSIHPSFTSFPVHTLSFSLNSLKFLGIPSCSSYFQVSFKSISSFVSEKYMGNVFQYYYLGDFLNIWTIPDMLFSELSLCTYCMWILEIPPELEIQSSKFKSLAMA